MAFILSRNFILSQLGTVGVTAAQLDASSPETKIAALKAVAMASLAANDQMIYSKQIEAGDQSIATGKKSNELMDLQIAGLKRDAGTEPAPV